VDDFEGTLTDDERETLMHLHRKAYGVPAIVGTEPEYEDGGLTKATLILEHASEESAMASVAANRVIYGHDASMQQVDGKWRTRIVTYFTPWQDGDPNATDPGDRGVSRKLIPFDLVTRDR
jgi:hypothetical protein